MFDTTTGTTYTDGSKLSAGKTYYYTVRAYVGDVETAKVNRYESAYWGHYEGDGLKTVYLDTPALKEITISASSLKVSWSKVSGATGYAIYRKAPGGSWGMIGTTTSTSYTDKKGIEDGLFYCYTVRTYKGNVITAKNHRYIAEYWSGYDRTGIEMKKLSVPVLSSNVKVVNTGLEIAWEEVDDAAGYAVYRKTGSADWKMIGTSTSSTYVDRNSGSSGTIYDYTVRAYRGDKEIAFDHKYNKLYWSGFDSTGVSGSAYAIEGRSNVTVEKMVRFYERYSPIEYPVAELQKGGADTLQEFAQIFYEEAKDEGIKPEIVWCQAMLETGYLKFGGDVKISQYNFAGIGATGGGAAGATFSDVREGVRAQVQHMKAYASSKITEKTLKHDLVDPRFKYVKKGSAKYVEILGIQENPQGTGWASAKDYGPKIINLINKLKEI